MPLPSRPWLRRRLLLGVAGATVLLAACGSSGYTFVGSAGDRVTLQVPSSWKGYQGNTILKAIGLDGTPSAGSFRWLVGYDGSPDPALGHVLTGVPSHPVVLAYVRTLSSQTRDKFSLQALRNARYPIDQLVNDDKGDVISHKDIVLEGGLHGAQDVFDITGGIGNVSASNGALMVNQIGILDPSTKKLYLLVISCDAVCYQHNKGTIDEIARSYSVKES
jgi:hypothetical protein